MSKLYIWISMFTLLALSCSTATVPAAIAAPAPPDSAISSESATVSDEVEMTVTAEKLNIRYSPGGVVVKRAYFVAGDVLTVYEVRNHGDYLWCAITPDAGRWVGCEWLEAK